ncbi:TPA: fimbrial protein [Klebsiella oxytoca]|nr:fimbrial protein [Klebsiella oxytoca]
MVGKKVTIRASRAFLLAGPLLMQLAAGEVAADATVNFHGTLQAASCSADAVDVDFGDVKVNEIDAASGSAIKVTDLNITCTGSGVGTIQYALKGTSASFNANALSTSLTGLGVLVNITAGGSAVNVVPEKWYPLNGGAGKYSLMSTLIRDKSVIAPNGNFSVTATIAIQIA